jgi:hypothetical protein
MRFDRGMLFRGVSVAALIAGVAFLGACGGSSSSGGGGGGSAVAIGLTRSPTFIDPGVAITVTAVVTRGGVTWSLSPAAFGTLSNQTSTSVTYTAPASVTDATAVTITATSTAQTSVVAPIQVEVRTSPVIALSTVGPQTINQGHQLSVNAALTGDTTNQGVTWSLSSGVGSLSNQTTTSVTYSAPASVTGNAPVTLVATSNANTHSTASLELTVVSSGAAANVAALTTAGGPVAPSTNSFYTSVTICRPGTSDCQTIDNILVDTGSEGLRVLEPLVEPLVLPSLSDASGGLVNNCIAFLDGSYLWGPVEFADIKIGGEATSSTPIQVISSSDVTVPTDCSSGGTVNENTAQLLGANGILGIGLEPTDCFQQGVNFCDGSTGTVATVYFDCPRSGCALTDAATTVSAADQLANPVTKFGADSNGTAIQMPALVSTSPEADGSLIFGIGTTSNNAVPGTATAFALDANDNFTTVFSGQTLASSFIDSGSNGLFFPSTITPCTGNTGFYCPATLQPLTATNQDAVGDTNVVTFHIDNADTLFSSNTDTAFSTLGGPGGANSFDWGAPFFYGRTVFTAIDGSSTPIGAGPFWAY